MTRLCSIEGCGKPLSAHGFCTTHDRRFKLYGSPMADVPVAGRGNKEWLLDHVNHSSADCLIWPFGKSQYGYGSIKAKFDGQVYLYAHIAMCALKHGPMPEPGMFATHSCGNGHLACVNPDHLRWGTPSSNNQDMVDHGRSNRGRGRLSEADVLNIRAMSTTKSQKEIASMYSVDPSTISVIMTGKTWGWLS